MILEYSMIDETTGATLGGVILDGESADTMAALFESVSGEKVREGTRVPGVVVTRVALRCVSP